MEFVDGRSTPKTKLMDEIDENFRKKIRSICGRIVV